MEKSSNERPGVVNKKKASDKNENLFLANLKDVVFIVSGIILVFSLLFRVVVVSGPSMKDTLIDGDWLLLVGNLFYNEPQPGDIIVASKESFEDGKPIIKRVIATEGQTVDIDFEEGIVYVDGVALDEPYTRTLTTRSEGLQFPMVIQENCIFVMGDNRDISKDSRSTDIGQIDCREVMGKAILIMFPGNEGGNEERDFDRIGVLS